MLICINNQLKVNCKTPKDISLTSQVLTRKYVWRYITCNGINQINSEKTQWKIQGTVFLKYKLIIDTLTLTVDLINIPTWKIIKAYISKIIYMALKQMLIPICALHLFIMEKLDKSKSNKTLYEKVLKCLLIFSVIIKCLFIYLGSIITFYQEL